MSSALIMLGVAFALTVFGQRFMPFSDSARKMFVRTMLPLILFLGVWIYLKYEKPASKSDTDSIKSDTQAIRDVLKRQTEKVAGPALTEIPTAKLEPPMLFAEFLDGVTDEAGSTSLSAYKWSHSGDTGFIQQNVRFRNHGGTPAVISSLKCGAIVSAVAPNQTVIDGADEVPIKTEIVIPQNERSVPFTCGPWVRWFPAPNPVQLRQDASHKLERMANGEVWFVGRVDYTDVNGTSSTTTLCARYRISGALELAGGDGCNQHTRSQR